MYKVRGLKVSIILQGKGPKEQKLQNLQQTSIPRSHHSSLQKNTELSESWTGKDKEKKTFNREDYMNGAQHQI